MKTLPHLHIAFALLLLLAVAGGCGQDHSGSFALDRSVGPLPLWRRGLSLFVAALSFGLEQVCNQITAPAGSVSGTKLDGCRCVLTISRHR